MDSKSDIETSNGTTIQANETEHSNVSNEDDTEDTKTENAPRELPKIVLQANKLPSYYIGGRNGVTIVDNALRALGWRRLTEKTDDSYTFKWTELKSQINYASFKEGEQMVNHIPNCNLITNKMGLLTSLQDYSKLLASVKTKTGRLRLEDFLPETYRLDDAKEKETFCNIFKEGEIWICKPTGMNQGKGIFLVRDLDQIRNSASKSDARSFAFKRPMGKIIQRYISNPLLLEGRKFDLRAYMLIACTTPWLVLFQPGYVRLSIHKYDMTSENLVAHLTNQFMQKKDPTYEEVKESTTWSMEQLNEYINNNVQAGQCYNWVETVLPIKMKQIMTYTFNAVRHKLQSKQGYFELYGFDFMIDDLMNVNLIEVNINPCLATNCDALRGVVPKVVTESIYLAIECFEKTRRGKSIFPLEQLGGFQVIFNGTLKVRQRPLVASDRSPTRTERARSLSPRRPAPARSPVKDGAASGPATAKLGYVTPGSLRTTTPARTRTARAHKSDTSLAEPTTADDTKEVVRDASVREHHKPAVRTVKATRIFPVNTRTISDLRVITERPSHDLARASDTQLTRTGLPLDYQTTHLFLLKLPPRSPYFSYPPIPDPHTRLKLSHSGAHAQGKKTREGSAPTRKSAPKTIERGS